MKTKKNFLKKLTAGILGFVMTLGVGAAGYAASASETKAAITQNEADNLAVLTENNFSTSAEYVLKSSDGYYWNGVSGTSSNKWGGITNKLSEVERVTISGSWAGGFTIKDTQGRFLSATTSNMTWTNTAGTYKVGTTTTGDYPIIYNGTANGVKVNGTSGIRVYTNLSYNATTGKPVAIYKIPSSGPTKLTTPKPSFSESTGKVTWDAISGASSYQVKIDDGDYSTATSPYTVPTLSRTDSHTVYVKAIASSGSTEYIDSDAGTCEIPIIKTPQSLSVTGAKDEFYIGDYFSFGGTATVSYGGSDTRTVTDLSFKIGSDYSSATAITTSTELTANHNGKNVYVVYTENDTEVRDSYSISVTAAPSKVTYDTTNQGYSNEEEVYSWSSSSSPVSVAFTASGNNKPKYYNTGTAVRVYAGGTVSVSAETGFDIVGVTFTFGSGDGTCAITANVGTFSSPTWEGKTQVVTFTINGTSGHRRIKAIEIIYAAGEVHYPVSVAAEFATEKGTYFNGSTNASKLSFTDVVGTFTLDNGNTQPVVTIDKIEIFEGSTLKGTLTSSSDKYSFEGATVSNSWSLKITCNGVAQGGGNLTSGALTITLNQVEASSYEWKSDAAQPTTEFYSHFDTYSLGGTLYATFNDGSHASQGSGHTRVDVIHEGSKTGTVIESIPSHTDGTINVTQNKTYWIESYFSQNADEGEHLFTEVSVKMPTMTVVNGDTTVTKYYTNVPFSPNPSITVKKGTTTVTGLTDSDFNVVLTVNGQTVDNPYIPTDSSQITVTVSLKKDSGISGSYTVTPTTSQKILTGLTISKNTFTAGDLFTFGAQDIRVDYTEGTEGFEYIPASSVDFTHNGDELNSSTRLLKNMNEWTIHAVYSVGSGEGQTVSTDFTITVNDKQISPYTPGEESNYYEKVTSTSNLTDGKYLIVYETGNVALNGALTADAPGNTISVTINNSKIARSTTIDAASVTFSASDGSFLGTGGKYIGHTGSSNTLDYSDSPLSNTVTFNSGDAEITNGSYVMKYNDGSGQNRFRYYKSGQKAIQLYKTTSTPDVGNKIDYLKSIVDAIRLNQQKYTQEDLKTELRAHSEWTKASGILAVLTPTEWNSLNVADAFGPSGSTYKSVYELAFACSVSFNGTHVSSNGASSCAPGAAYNATLTVDQGYQLTKENISITMGGSSFTDFSYENGSLEILAGKITGDLVITAEATVINYTITYNADYGVVSSPNPETYNVETAATTLNPAIKTGHQFLGWFTENGKTTGEWGSEVTQIGGGATGDLVLYAKYSVENYTVTFLGTNVTSDGAENCDYGETYTATLSVQGQFHLPGSISVMCGSNAVECSYNNTTGALSFTMPAGNVTITANATSDCAISYCEVDGTAITGDYLINSYQEGVGVTLVNAHDKTGYVFAGWYDNDHLTGSPVTVVPTTARGSLTFYAKWTYAGQDALDCVSTNLGVSYTYSKDGGDPVVSKAPTGYHYEKATSIAVGDTVALVCEGQGQELGGISTTSTKYGIGVSTTKGVVDGAMPLEVVAGSETGTFAFKTGDNYLRWNSGNSLDAIATSVEKNSSWNVSITGGNASISNANDANRIIWWNVGSPRFACYTGKSDGNEYNYVQLYKLVSDTPTPPPGPTYDSTFKFNVKNTGMSSLIDMYRGVYDDMGIAVSYTDSNNIDRVRYFSFIEDENGKFWVKEANKDPIEFKFNKDGTSFALNLGDVLNNIDVANIEFTVQAYIYEGGVYHLSENETTMSLMDWIDGYYAIPKYQAAVKDIYDILHEILGE